MDKSMKKIITFVGIIFVLAIYTYYEFMQNISNVFSGAEFTSNKIIIYGPFVAVILIKLIYDRSLKGLGLGLGKMRYLLAGYFLPIIACLIVYPIAWIVGIGGFEPEMITIVRKVTFGKAVLLYGTLNFLMGAFTNFISGELAWRGFLVPTFYKELNFSYTKTALVTGAIQYIYYLPFFLLVTSGLGSFMFLSLFFYTISFFALSFIATWLRIKSGSIWPPLFLYTSYNLFVNVIFNFITINNEYTKLFTGNYGLGLAVVYVIVAFYFWTKRDRLDVDTITKIKCVK